MRSYRRLQRVLLAIFALQLGLAAVEVAVDRKGLVFPATSWALFERVPNRLTLYALRVRAIDGRGLDPPPEPRALATVLPEATSPEARATIEALGVALAGADAVAVAGARRTLEALYLAGHRVGYAIEERIYPDPFVAWQGGPPLAARTLGVFATDGARR